MARLRLLVLANAHCLPPALGHTIAACGAVEEMDRIVLAVLDDATLTCAGVTMQVGAW